MKSKIMRNIVAVPLAAALIFVSSGTGAAADGEAASQTAATVANKTEVVYATLSASGDTSAVYVVNQFEVTTAGTVTDYGDYTSVTNLTDTGMLTQQGDEVSFYADAGTFYYQGNIASTDLPWIVGVTYELNGQETAPSGLAGQSGQLKIHITTRRNSSVDAAFYNNYMLQITATLDNEKCADISAPGATVASAGQDTAITYTVLPGKDADVTLSATVSDFEMEGIQVAGMPMSFDFDLSDSDSMTDDFDKLVDAIDDLNDGVGNLVDGAAGLKSAASKLKSGSVDIQQGLSQLSDNSGQLADASAQIKAALSQIVSSLSDSLGDMDLDDMQQLPAALSQLSGGLTGISNGLATLKENFATAYAALDAAIGSIPDETLTQDQIDALYAGTDESLHGDLNTLVGYYAAGQTVKATYGQVKAAFDAIGTTIDTLCGNIDTIAATLQSMSQQMADALSGLAGLSQLAAGLTELSNNYASFHDGLTDYLDGVVQLDDGYASFHSGLGTFASGVGDYYDGIKELYDGTTELRDETADLPDEVQSKINELKSEYSGEDFTPVSFMSSKNTNIRLVQFVFKCEGIEKPEETSGDDETETDNETFWDRLVDLFGGKE